LPASAPVAPPGVALDEVEGGGVELPAGFALELEAGAAPASFFAFGAGCTAAGATGVGETGGAIAVGSALGAGGVGSAIGAADALELAAGSSEGFERAIATIPTMMPSSRKRPPIVPASMII